MAERLPVVGSDDNTWGIVLNHFLRVSFNADGSLNTNATITYSDATSPAFTDTGNPNPNYASGSAPGLVQLDNDLGGTAQLPTVVSTHLSSALPVNQGGTSSASLTANAVLLGNGTSALQTIAAGTAGNVLTDNGSTWISRAPASPRTFAYFVGS